MDTGVTGRVFGFAAPRRADRPPGIIVVHVRGAGTERDSRLVSVAIRTLRAVVPGVWIGLLVGLAFIETPLKFLAPGVDLPIALGIGRLVLTAADVAGVVMLAVLTVLSLLRPRLRRAGLVTVGTLWVVLLIQVAAIRPQLNARTDAILAGAAAGESQLHTFYVVADVLLMVGLVIYIVLAARQRVPESVPVSSVHAGVVR